jgi:hypothetical protein
MADWSLIRFSDNERIRARTCAVTRLSDAKKAGAKDRFGHDSEDSHYWGALGEIAVAKHIDTKWECTSRAWAARDVGRYEVRSNPPGTEPYVKAKKNDPPLRPIALVVFESDQRAWIVGWITAQEIRERGVESDPGGRGAPAYFLRDLSYLNPVFPEIRMPWDPDPAQRRDWRTDDLRMEGPYGIPEKYLSAGEKQLIDTNGRAFPLQWDEEGNIEINWETCPDCGARFAIHAEHIRSPEHRRAIALSQTMEGQTSIPEVEQPDTFKFTEMPAKVDFGIHTICPRCKGFRRKKKGVREELASDPAKASILCVRCNGFGIVPNVGPVPTVLYTKPV